MPALDARFLEQDPEGVALLSDLFATDPNRAALLRRPKQDAFRPKSAAVRRSPVRNVPALVQAVG